MESLNSRNGPRGWKSRESRESTALAYHLPRSRAAQTERKEYTGDAFLFYSGHAKFPDRVAPRTARVRKPICKRAGDTDATEARRFVDRRESSRDRSTWITEGKRRETSRQRLVTRFFSFFALIIATIVRASDRKRTRPAEEIAIDQPQFLQL